jgi:hypothetical protein
MHFKKLCCLLSLILVFSCTNPLAKIDFEFITKFELSEGTETATYPETIKYYKYLALAYPEISLIEMGTTDSGYPLHLVVFNSSKEFEFDKIRNKNVILINNAIHPGESDGVDASMLLLRDIVQDPYIIAKLDNIVLAVIPIYNIGGALNRNSTSRANQNGPKEYGFRGNARNFDLNRDFIKSDTKNTKTFAQIFHLLNPDIFIDNHVSNGADYQYAITHLFTQHNKLGNDLGAFIENKMRPALEASLLKKNIPITPYVNVWRKTPDEGFSQFFDRPRYSSGYTTLFNTFGMMIETHMLKPYKQRVQQTYNLLESMIDFTVENGKEIKELRENAVTNILARKTYPIAYELDKNTFSTFQFKGYEGRFINSKVTSGKRLFYDRNKPFTKPIKYFNQFKPSTEITISKAYILKQGWWKVLERFNDNNIIYKVFKNDTTIAVEEQHIKNYKTHTTPFEGHYPHYDTTVSTKKTVITFSKGDIYIPVRQSGARYIMETLEAVAADSFFNWNYFDIILQPKGGYSGYVFEDIAAQFLVENPRLKDSLNQKIQSDHNFAQNPRAQLDFIYKNSPHSDKQYLKLPVYKVY